MKHSKSYWRTFWILLFIFGVVLIMAIGSFVGIANNAKNKQNNQETTSNITDEPLMSEDDTTVVEKHSVFETIGFSSDESKTVELLFKELGLTQIDNIQRVTGKDVSELSSYKIFVFGFSSGYNVTMTVENRTVCYIEFSGYFDGWFSEPKTITLYDKWNDNGEIDETINPYKAKFDFQNKKFVSVENEHMSPGINSTTIGDEFSFGDFAIIVKDIYIPANEYYNGAGFHLAKITLQLTNIATSDRLFVGSEKYGASIHFGDYSYSSSSIGGYTSSVQPLQTVSVEVFFHLPNVVCESTDELIFCISQNNFGNITNYLVKVR